MRLLVVLLLASLVLAGCGAPQEETQEGLARTEPGPAPAHERNRWLLETPRPPGADVSGGAEPTILADHEGKYLWIGDVTGGYWSDDNGTEWHPMPGLDPVGGLFRDGWDLAQDDAGTLYAVGLNGPTLFFGASTDGGRSWDTTNPAIAASTITDRPWIAARGDGEVSVIFWDGLVPLNGRIAGVSTGQEYCARTTDGGITWPDRNPVAGQPQAGNLVYDDAGALHYMDDTGVAYRFADGCIGSLAVQRVLGDTMDFFPDTLGANNMLQLAHDDGAFYAVAAGAGNDEIYVSGVQQWGDTPTVIDIAPPELLSNTFAVVSAHEGEVAVSWYGSESTGDPSSASFTGAFNVYVARVDDLFGSPDVDYVRVTTEPNHVGDICMAGIGCGGGRDRDLLDYFGIDHDKWGGVHVAYGHDGTGSDAVVRYAHLPPAFRPPPANEAPSASFTYSLDGCAAAFDASASDDPDGTIAVYDWDFGDGRSGAAVAPSHTYSDDGAYPVVLTVTDDAGYSATASATVVAQCDDGGDGGDGGGGGDGGDGGGGGGGDDQPPHAAFTVSETRPLEGQRVRFDDGSSDDGGIAQRTWDFGDGASSTQTDPSHTYTAAGTYTVRLTVEDGAGQSDSATASVQVLRNLPPEAAFTIRPRSPVAGDEVVLRDTSSDDGAITERRWDLGDGSVADTAVVRHTYPAGFYHLRLTVTDEHGAQQSVHKTMRVREAAGDPEPPEITFSAEPGAPRAGEPVTFRASGDASTWQWDIAGRPASGTVVRHTFDAAGSYTVRLTAADDGLESITSRTIQVAEPVMGQDTADKGAPWPWSLGLVAVALVAMRRR